jgi:hypothetical protein
VAERSSELFGAADVYQGHVFAALQPAFKDRWISKALDLYLRTSRGRRATAASSAKESTALRIAPYAYQKSRPV